MLHENELISTVPPSNHLILNQNEPSYVSRPELLGVLSPPALQASLEYIVLVTMQMKLNLYITLEMS